MSSTTCEHLGKSHWWQLHANNAVIMTVTLPPPPPLLFPFHRSEELPLEKMSPAEAEVAAPETGEGEAEAEELDISQIVQVRTPETLGDL